MQKKNGTGSSVYPCLRTLTEERIFNCHFNHRVVNKAIPFQKQNVKSNYIPVTETQESSAKF